MKAKTQKRRWGKSCALGVLTTTNIVYMGNAAL